MSVISGFTHSCDTERLQITNSIRSINDYFDDRKILADIWEFYVTKTPSMLSSQSIEFEYFGWRNTVSKTDGYGALEKLLYSYISADFKLLYVRAKSISDSLKEVGLSGNILCVDHPRGVLMQNFSYSHKENETVKVESSESKVNCLFRHIRNSLAHGNTYLFDNGNILLEDKDKSKITARIIIPIVALHKWMIVVKEGPPNK
ncbi:MAG: hypothetical protein ACOX58_00575 [Christensenellales bacterium]|jgi:hypothetical protein